MAKRTRVVLVGCGGICDKWMTPAVRERIELVGLVDLLPAAAEQRRVDFNAPGALCGTDLKAILKSTDPEVVFDCTVPEAHHSVTVTALKHGCHVLGEKPLADTMTHARAMVAAAGKADRIYAVIQNRRYRPQIRALRKFIESGKIGRVTTVQSNFFVGAHFGGFRDVMAHALLLEMSIHSFDQARLMSGADAQHVYCHEWNPAGSWYKHGASAVAIFEMTDDIVYTYQGAWSSEGCNTSWECAWHIVGDKGSVAWDGDDSFKAQAVRSDGGFYRPLRDLTVPVRVPQKKTGSHSGVILEFLDCVRHGGQPETHAAENIKSLAMVFGAIKSANAGKRVRVD